MGGIDWTRDLRESSGESDISCTSDGGTEGDGEAPVEREGEYAIAVDAALGEKYVCPIFGDPASRDLELDATGEGVIARFRGNGLTGLTKLNNIVGRWT